MTVDILKTSDQWLKLPDYSHVVLVNPSGWETPAEFYTLKLTEADFLNRLTRSTIKLLEND